MANPSGPSRMLRPSATWSLFHRSSLPSMLSLLVVLLSTLAVAAPVKGLDMHAGTLLTGATFSKSIADGIWLVEHYSPYCHHCRDFAPTWIELANSRKSQEESINFHFGQVDCSVDGDLCDSNNVKGYPSVFLYENGQYVETFKKERTLVAFNKWLDARLPDEPAKDKTGTDTQEDPVPIANPGDQTTAAAKENAPSRTPEHALFQEGAPTTAVAIDQTPDKELIKEEVESAPALKVQQAHVDMQKRITPNPEGKVISATRGELEDLIKGTNGAGPVFVKYYAPWCGHCKHLAPVWVQVADQLRNKVNVVEFNCDLKANKERCGAEGIKGYPTLIFYNEGQKREYNGGRDLHTLVTYAARTAASTGVRELAANDLPATASREEVFFLLLHPAQGSQEDEKLVRTAAGTLLGSVPVFMSSSPELFSKYDYPANQASLLVFKDHSDQFPAEAYNLTSRATSTTGNAASDRQQEETKLISWIHANRFPTTAELTGSNFKEYMEDGQLRKEAYVIVAPLSQKALGEQGVTSAKADLDKIASAWRKATKFNPRDKLVHFVWVNADTWATYLSSGYKIDPHASTPQVIITNPIRDEYYSVDIKKQPLTLDGRQIFAALEDLYEGKLKPKISLSVGERIARFIMDKVGFIFVAIGNHPILSAFLGLAFFIIFFCVLVFLFDEADTDGHAGPQPKFVNNGQSLYSAIGVNTNNAVKKD